MNLSETMREKTNEAIVKQNSENLQTLKYDIMVKIRKAAGNGESKLRFFINLRPRQLNENVGVVIPSKFEDEIRFWLLSEGFVIDNTNRLISW